MHSMIPKHKHTGVICALCIYKIDCLLLQTAKILHRRQSVRLSIIMKTSCDGLLHLIQSKGATMKSISVLIKPASSLCNLRCRYCFYADIAENREIPSTGIMKEETADKLIERIAEVLEEKGTANISFQGGEPTVAGLDYFIHFAEKMKAYPGIRVNYSLQTNATLITEEWAEFFHENSFLIGVSLDGYKLNMDQFRFDAEHNSVFDRIMDSIKLLRRYKVDFNILTVVTADLSAHARGLFRFYKEQKFDYVQLIPCLPGFHTEADLFALTPDQYASFYIEFFDEWYREVQKGHVINISLFDNIYGMLQGQMPYQCGMLGRCSVQFVIEANGDVYPCDFYCLDEYRLGNLCDLSFPELALKARPFIAESKCTKAPCKTCRYIRMCSGGCRRQNVCYLNDEYCSYQKVLDHIIPLLQRLR